MKVGDLVKDLRSGEIGVIIETDACIWDDPNGYRVEWDFKIMCEDKFVFADRDELEVVDESR